MSNKHLENAKIFKAFCDETRLKVLSLLQSGEKCACVLLEKVNVRQPTLSHHIKILVESGIVTARKEGKWKYFSLCKPGTKKAVKLLKELTTLTLDESDNTLVGTCRELEIMETSK